MRVTRDKSVEEEAKLKEIGERIKMRRTQLGYSLEDLSKALGVSRTQIFKYEVGEHRIDCMRMLSIASFMKVPVAYFLQGKELTEKSEELATYFNKLSNEIIRSAIINLCKAMSEVPEITG